MYLYVNEWKKIIYRRSYLLLVIGLIALNALLFWNQCRAEFSDYSAQAYRQIYTYIKGMHAKQAQMVLKDQYEKLRFYQSLSFGEDGMEELKEHPQWDGQTMYQDYQKERYLVYTDNLYSEISLYQSVMQEVDSCAEYRSYLKGIEEKADSNGIYALFTGTDSYTYKNLQKTARDFQGLQGHVLPPEPSKGVVLLTGFLPTDLFALVLILVAVVQLVTRERENHQLPLVQTCYRGRYVLGMVKAGCVVRVSLYAELLLYAGNLIQTWYICGFGNTTRYLQAVQGFGGSSWNVDVNQYLGLFFGAKLLVYLMFAGLFYLLTVLVSSSTQVYVIGAMFVGAEALIYETISSVSWLSVIKYINLAAFLNTQMIFLNYRNLNFFGVPCNVTVIFFVGTIGLLLSSMGLAICCFAWKRGEKRGHVGKKHVRIAFLGGTTVRLVHHEWYKVWISQRVLFFVIALVGILLYTHIPVRETFDTMDAIYYKQYMKQLEGPVTKSKQEYIATEQRKIQEAGVAMTEEMQKKDADTIAILIKYQGILAPQQALEQVRLHAEYLRTTEEGEFLYDRGYCLLAGKSDGGKYNLQLNLLFFIMIVLCVSGVYGMEYQTGANVLLSSSYRGRRNTYLIKYAMAAGIVLLLYCFIYGPYTYEILKVYGTAGIHAAVCSVEAFPDWHISILAYLVGRYVLRFLVGLGSICLLFWIAKKTRSIVGTLMGGTLVLVLPWVLALILLR